MLWKPPSFLFSTFNDKRKIELTNTKYKNDYIYCICCAHDGIFRSLRLFSKGLLFLSKSRSRIKKSSRNFDFNRILILILIFILYLVQWCPLLYWSCDSQRDFVLRRADCISTNAGPNCCATCWRSVWCIDCLFSR